MVDMTELSAYHGSAAAAKNMSKRRRSQNMLKVYGIIAISLAGLALIALLYSVVGKAAGALTESYVTLEVPISAEEVDPENPGKADFGGLVKDALKEKFQPNGRQARRELYDLVSSGAAFELRDQVINAPDMIGKTANVRLLSSDVTDLYLKGSFGEMENRAHAGNLSVVPTDKDGVVRVLSSSNDFADALAVVKDGLLAQARQQRRQAALQDNAVRVYTRRVENADTDEAKETAKANLISATTERDRLIGLAEDLEARAAQPGGKEKLGQSEPSVLIEVGSGWIKLDELTSDEGTGHVVMPVEFADQVAPKDWKYHVVEVPEQSRKVSDNQIIWTEILKREGKIERVFNSRFFTAGDSREPELAGIWGAAVGSFWTMLVTFLLAFPIGVMAAIYLEEFAPKNRITDFIEVNINNLAAVPSIVFGLLGLAVFLSYFGVPRSSPLAGGIVLALMTLPTIIIASRAAIRAVPPSIRDAALGLGASKLQTSSDHVLPLAMPGILTGTIIGMAQALGETAPLIMIGMVAFIVDIPSGVTDSATVLPVQIYRWSDFPERAFESRTAAAICTLLLFLVIMNALAVFLRKRFERRW
ncbi:phosphate ABC transporter permease PstA [Halovulum sp. GXIMD14793]